MRTGFRIGVDLGGTKIAAVAFDAAGALAASRRIATPAGDYDATVAAIVGLVASLESEIGTPASVGIGIPGNDRRRDRSRQERQLDLADRQPLARDVETALGRAVRFANDANCFALSEAIDGAASGFDTVFGVILGTGVGGGIVTGGRLLVGANAIAGEWGHNPLPAPARRPGNCRGRPAIADGSGCIETFLSGPVSPPITCRRRQRRGRAERSGDRGRRPRRPGRLPRDDRPLCRAFGPLARRVINLLDPDAIVLGGGLSSLALLYEEVPRLWGRYVFSDTVVTRLLPPLTATPAACAAPPGCGRPDGPGTRKSRRTADERGAVPRLQRARRAIAPMPALPARCPQCGSPRVVAHPELADLALAHLDCDAFYATVEKRGSPELADRPVIVGGGERGVVLACCYVARLYGVRSAMPMFKALAACPDAVVIRPDMAKYREVGREVRVEMRRLTPLVEPLSIDEAFLDLSGTARRCIGDRAGAGSRRAGAAGRGGTRDHGLDRPQLQQVSRQARLRSGQAARFRGDRAGGGGRVSRRQAGRLAVGGRPAMQRRLAADGILRIGQLRALDRRELAHRYGKLGLRLAELACGEDSRRVAARHPRQIDLGRDDVCARRSRRGGAGASAAGAVREFGDRLNRPGLAPPA